MLAPEPAIAAAEPVYAMRVREPQPAPPAQYMREQVYHVQVAGKRPREDGTQVASKRKSNGKQTFNTYQRKTLTPDEIEQLVEPEGEFDLEPDCRISAEECEARIEARGRSLGISLSKQAIAKQRTEWGKSNSQIAARIAELKKLKKSQDQAAQIEKVFIYAERLRDMVEKRR